MLLSELKECAKSSNIDFDFNRKINVELIYNTKYQKNFDVLHQIFSDEALGTFMKNLVSFIEGIDNPSILLEISITEITYSFSIYSPNRQNKLKYYSAYMYSR